ncbi:hypothetical protein J2B92_09825 [Lysinibacillus sphaericus]|uniref:hypothetical protein n=1 Tax=Lysinibacillus sphaericus TaxID=1421 RepID=UPI0018CCCD0E|nr:hypothetical protein [Lysinibacillus sphaericus]QTB15455.1 hypothetical protein J2B92_09825 [Lysinibacillus sphaericus]
MSNLKGAILAMALWVGVVFPFLLSFGIDSLQQRAYLSTTEKMAELLRQEGGVSDQVQQVANNLKSKGYIVTFSKPSLVQFGEEIVIRYQYEYENVRGKQKLDTQNKVVIAKRIVADGGSNPPKVPQTYSATTPESLNANGEYTIRIPGLNNLLRVTSNTGDAEIVRVNGEEVTVKVSKGNVSKKVQTGGEYIPADTKFVTEQKALDYNKDGYRGTLQPYDKIPASSKKIVDYEQPLYGRIGYACKNGQWENDGYSTNWNRDTKYSDSEGYEGYIGERYGGTFKKVEMDYNNVVNNPDYVDEYGLLDNTSQKVNLKSPCSKEMYPEEGIYLEEDWMYLQASGTEYFVVGKLLYSGTVQRPEVSLYQGNVTRPEKDTRTYNNYYQYQLDFEYMSN